jgi:hypothetical protein
VKTTIILAAAAIAAFLYLRPSDKVIEAPRVVEPMAAAPRESIVVAPMKTDRLKTGPNAQTDLTLKRSW